MKKKLFTFITLCICLFTSCADELPKSENYHHEVNPFIVLHKYEPFIIGGSYVCYTYVIEDTITHNKYLCISSGHGSIAITEYKE